jgi:hypothetical protein
MSVARLSRDRKRQLGQYLTPPPTAAAIVGQLQLSPDDAVLEPSFGQGSFVFALINALASTLSPDELQRWYTTRLYGCEIDGVAYDLFAKAWESRGLGQVPQNLERGDFFTWLPPGCDRTAATDRRRYFASRLERFDLIVGNPPFGGSINPSLQDDLDSIFGSRDGRKIKKETYAFFIVKAIDLLKPGGRLVFICSDTMLTIPTMTGLRNWVQSTCQVHVSEVPGSFDDTDQDMLLLTLTKAPTKPTHITVFDRVLLTAEIEAIPNLSWRIDDSLARYFTGTTVGHKMVATSGMTIGNNELFLRRIDDNRIEEPYEFAMCEQKITVEGELSRARLRKLSSSRLRELRQLEQSGATETVVKWHLRTTAKTVELPHADYCHYNKASSRIVYADPQWVVFWRDDGAHVYTFKKTGNWYLRGVGGRRFFRQEGLTWALIAPRLRPRYLPPGYILDSGAPCAFLRDGVPYDELFFILGWALTDVCSLILKGVLNHTRNIQSKDFERLPYPVWVAPKTKRDAIAAVKALIARARAGELLTFEDEAVKDLNRLYAWHDCLQTQVVREEPRARQLALL